MRLLWDWFYKPNRSALWNCENVLQDFWIDWEFLIKKIAWTKNKFKNVTSVV